jgi:Ca2+-binding EF-hand superfamily protein
VDDPTAKKGDEASSHQALSEENQAKLKEVFSLLQRDIQDQVVTTRLGKYRTIAYDRSTLVVKQ